MKSITWYQAYIGLKNEGVGFVGRVFMATIWWVAEVKVIEE